MHKLFLPFLLCIFSTISIVGGSGYLSPLRAFGAESAAGLLNVNDRSNFRNDAVVIRCVRTAGFPDEPGGVAWAQLNHRDALRLCGNAHKRYPKSPYVAAMMARSLLKAGDVRKATQLLSRFRNSSDPWINALLGYAHETGVIGKRDYQTALKHFQVAAKSGSSFARNRLGWLYEVGTGTDTNGSQALELYRASAKSGDPRGMANVGWAFERGVGVASSMESAIEWYSRAAEGGDAWSIVRLAELVLSGKADLTLIPVDTKTKELIAAYRPVDVTISSILEECGSREQTPKRLMEQLEKLPLADREARDLVIKYAVEGSEISNALRVIRQKQNGEAVDGRVRWFAIEVELLLASDLPGAFQQRIAELGSDASLVKIISERVDYQEVLGKIIIPYQCVLGNAAPEYEKLFDKGLYFLSPIITFNILCGLSSAEANSDATYARARKYLIRASSYDTISANLLAHYRRLHGEDTSHDFLRLAIEGNIQAQRNIAAIYNTDKLDLRSAQLSFQWSYLAALQGHGSAQAQLAKRYRDGTGVGRNTANAINYYRQAALNGYAQAYLPLARLLLEAGKDRAEAAALYVRAYGSTPDDRDAIIEEIGQHQLLKNNGAKLKDYYRAEFIRVIAKLQDNELKSAVREISYLRNGITSFRTNTENAGALSEELRTLSILAAYLKLSVIDDAIPSGAVYFRDLTKSCVFGNLSRELFDANFKEEALMFARRSVNLLQDARKSLRDLPHDLRECFLKVHEDRYRWLADLFVSMDRLDQAEQVLLMLQDFEYSEYVRGPSLVERYAHIPSELFERAVAGRIDLAMGTMTERLIRAQYLTRNRVNLTKADSYELEALTASLKKNDGIVHAALDEVNLALSQLRAGHKVESFERHSVVDCLATSAPSCSTADFVAGSLGPIQNALRARLKQGNPTAAILTYVLPQYTNVILITAESRTAFKWQISSTDLNRLILDFREAIAKGADEKPFGERLYDGLVRPLLPELQASGSTRLLLALDRALGYIAPAALYDGKQYLAESYSLSLLSQTKPDLSNREGWKIAAFGVATAVGNWSPLQSVPDELRGIVRQAGETEGVYEGKRWLNEAFDLVALEDALAEQYPVVHFATHFDVGKEGVNAAKLVLGSGELALPELLKLHFNDVQLIVLSACSTGLPATAEDGNHFTSAARLIYDRTAVSSVLGTLWPVRDPSTAIAMRDFYRILATEPNLNEADALVRVQREFLLGRVSMKDSGPEVLDSGSAIVIRSAEDWTKPKYWAPFILWGS
ncbi:CHAT domain-containing protein [Rhizobium leguminosarum]|uniref:CHAT domain-containing protein n=1 Tax=Rhizobium leguminosarum TaxID=384 RepID=UPI001C955727|nr:CHAT domain-containing protein [Rhizobium leguminosarum]MBY5394629.1 CHAT domain-containing protein [Rhizobium leguminosarum]